MLFLKSSKANLLNSPIKHMADEDLLQRFWQGNQHHFIEELFDRYTHIVFGICLKYLENEDDAKDMVMQVFERLLVPASKTEVRNFKSWIYTLTKNQCLMQMRQKRKEPRKDLLENLYEEIMENDEKQHHIDLDTIEQNLLLAIERLNPDQGTCIKLFYLNHHSYAQISQLTGFDDKQVKSYIQNGKRNLRMFVLNAK
jgi:RNA polymerase sigma-70 factor (ECF subfamily)